MGRSVKVRFVVRMSQSPLPGATTSYTEPTAWPTKYAGRPSDANLAAYIAKYEESTRPGGVNAHLGSRVVFKAEVVDQETGAVRATYRGPAFAAV